MRVIITGGGTGGHIYPALAIANGIIKEFPKAEVLYVGNEKGLEKELATRANYAFCNIAVAGLPRPLSLKTIKALGTNLKGLAEARGIVKSFKPDLVVGTGGYACGPLMLVAALKKVPTLLHEQNAVMGVTNSILSRFVKKICLTFPITNANFKAEKKAVITGLPVRELILQAQRQNGINFFKLNPAKPVVLITGGSQGALSLNKNAGEIWRQILQAGGQIIHIAGESQFGAMAELATSKGLKTAAGYEEGFVLLPYLHQMEQALGAADVILGRAGASFLAEVMAIGRAAVLVPYPYAAGNHQQANAQALVAGRAAKMILDKDLTPQALWQSLQPLLLHPEQRQEMAASSFAMGKRDAVADILAEAKKIL